MKKNSSPSIFRTRQQEKAEKREEIIREYLALYREVPKKQKTIFKKQFAESKGIASRTLDSWVILFREGGPSALFSTNGSPRMKVIEKNPKMAQFIQDAFLQKYGPPIKAVYEDLVQQFQDEPKLPSLRTVYNYINSKWTKAQQEVVREPEVHARKSLYINRDWEAVDVNEIWFGDAKQIDVACIYKEKVIFPWVSIFMDARSRKFVACLMVPTHDSLVIGQAFRYAVERHGVPKTVYIDRGKDYKSRYMAGEKEKEGPEAHLFEDINKTRIPGVFRSLNVEIFFAYPQNAREKINEPNQKIFTYRLRHLPGYRGHNTKTRPKKLAREIKKRQLLSFEELATKIYELVHKRNSQIVHSSTKRIPDSFYENFIPEIPSKAVLDYLLMEEFRSKVRNSGVSINGHFYRGNDLLWLNGEDVEVRRDPQNVTRVAIIHGEQILSAYEEMPGHYRGSITHETRKAVEKIKAEERQFRNKFWHPSGTFDDPLREEIRVTEEKSERPRDIRPPLNPKVVQFRPKEENKARNMSKVLAQANLNETEEDQAAAVGESRNILPLRVLNALGGCSFGRKKPNDEAF